MCSFGDLIVDEWMLDCMEFMWDYVGFGDLVWVFYCYFLFCLVDFVGGDDEVVVVFFQQNVVGVVWQIVVILMLLGVVVVCDGLGQIDSNGFVGEQF